MISAYQAGIHAGSSTSDTGDPMELATRSLAVRKVAGIAHIFPEADYLLGFVTGYEQRQYRVVDGLCLAEKASKQTVVGDTSQLMAEQVRLEARLRWIKQRTAMVDREIRSR